MAGSLKALGRPPIAITTPCLTRHQVYFLPAFHKDNDSKNKILEQVKCVVGRFLALSACFQATKISDPFLKHVIDISDKIEKIRSHLKPMVQDNLEAQKTIFVLIGEIPIISMVLRISITMYYEHLTITYVLDSIEHTFSESERLDIFARHLAGRLPQKFRRSSDERCNLYLNEVIYENVWDYVDYLMWDGDYVGEPAAKDLEFAKSREIYDKVKKCGKKVYKGESRGAVMTANPHDMPVQETDIFSDLQRSFDSSEVIDKTHKADVRRAFDRQRQFLAATLGIKSEFNPAYGRNDHMRRDTNAVVCYMAGKSALYGSVLVCSCDQQSNSNDRRIFPVYPVKENERYLRFFLIYDGTNDSSVGRIVRRINVLFELKMLAFVEKDEVSKAHQTLILLNDALSETLTDILDAAGFISFIKSILLDSNLKKVLSCLNNLNKWESKVFQNIKQYNNNVEKILSQIENSKCSGGLSYRINRSYHYYNALLARMEDMRIERIKGFQPYDRFVFRYFYHHMQQMNSIKERHEMLAGRVERALAIENAQRQKQISLIGLVLAIFAAIITFSKLYQWFVLGTPP